MSNDKRRVEKLYAALMARERALLALQAMKEDQDEDPGVRHTMPREQGSEFNHHIFLMNSVSCEPGMFIFWLRAQIDILQVKLSWLGTLKLWALNNASLANYILMHSKEPTMRSEYERRVEEGRAEMIPVSELAQMLVEDSGGWTNEDLEPDDESGDPPLVIDAAWNRIHREKKREIARLVKDGVLEGKGRGRRFRVKAGLFYDWIGEPMPVFPDWGSEYEVLSDEQRRKVEGERIRRSHAKEMCRRAPHDIIRKILIRP